MNHVRFALLSSLLLTAVLRAADVEIIAHRGASYDAPENTLAAFRLAWEQASDATELDIHLTKDGHIVAIHDPSTKRTTGINRPVLEQTLAELREQNAGLWKGPQWPTERIPTLTEALAAMPDGKRTFIEIKCGAEVLPELERVLADSGKRPEQLVLIGFDYDTMTRAKQVFPHLQVYWVVDSKKKDNGPPPKLKDLAEKSRAAGFDGLDLSYKFPLDAAAVQQLKDQGLKIFVWTVDDAAVAAHLAAAGVDGITTNRPQWLREQLARSTPAQRPNILLIVSDDQGYPDLGCIGAKPIKTTNLDRLAAEGVRATSFYVTWPACTPSRGSLLTGRYPQRNGLYDMVRNDLVNFGHRYSAEEYAVSPEMTLGLDPREITLGDVLRQAGYRTGMVGKWDMGQARRYLPLQRGFDFFYGHGNNGIDYYTHERYGVHSLFAGNERSTADQGTYATDLFERESLRFLRQSTDQPWFLYLAFNAPHGASSFAPDNSKTADGRKRGVGVQAPEEYVAPYRAQGIGDSLARYYGAVTRMDAAICAIFSHLRQSGQMDNTLVLFFTDNGGSGNGGNAPLRGQKSTMWEGGLRVPFIAAWPGHLPAGKVTDEFLTSLEIFPTLLAVAGANSPPNVTLDGFNLLPVLRGEKPSSRSEMFWQRRADKAARVGNFKWVDSAAGSGLYDLSSDLGEQHDLSAEMPDVLARVRARFLAWRAEMDAAEPRGPFRDY
jgi:arylsulfatase A-like enzyme/glycerophosphoryl diester phosphodiesterase